MKKKENHEREEREEEIRKSQKKKEEEEGGFYIGKIHKKNYKFFFISLNYGIFNTGSKFNIL